MEKKLRKTQVRSVLTRRKLLDVAIECFAVAGYEGTGTREVAKRAGANLSAIRYHFGDKDGLYRAVIEHISEGVSKRISPFVRKIRASAENPDTSRPELTEALCHLISEFASQLLGSGIGDNWARLVIREQVKPTGSFAIMYTVFKQILDLTALIVARITGHSPDSKQVRICAMTIVGQALVFRTHRATALKFIGWKKLGPSEISALKEIVSSQCHAIVTIRTQ